MEDTLRYFFSAMFQGFAAIITLGAMYFLYFLDKIESQKNNIIDKLKPYAEVETTNRDFTIRNGIIECVKQKVLPLKIDVPQYDTARYLINKYDSFIEKELNTKKYLSILLKKTITILILSLCSLFLIGYNNYLNYFLLLVGIISLFISIKVLVLVKNIIAEIMLSK